jgi:hypothetical protein
MLKDKIILVAPTGFGQTVLAGAIAAELAKHTHDENVVLVDLSKPTPFASLTVSDLEFNVSPNPYLGVLDEVIMPISKYISTGETKPKTCFDICKELGLTKYNLLANEYNLIAAKQSKLSRKQRDAVIEAYSQVFHPQIRK